MDLNFFEKILDYADKDPKILIYSGIFIILVMIAAIFLFAIAKITKSMTLNKTNSEKHSEVQNDIITKQHALMVDQGNILNSMSEIQNNHSELLVNVADRVNDAIVQMDWFKEINIKNQKILESLFDKEDSNLTTDDVKSIVGAYSGKVIARIELFFRARTTYNHIEKDYDKVQRKYENEMSDIIDRFQKFLGKNKAKPMRHQGSPLIDMDGEDGLETMFRYLFQYLLTHQYMVAIGEPTVHYSVPDLLERFQSQLIIMSSDWCEVRKTISESSIEQVQYIQLKDYPIPEGFERPSYWIA